MKSKAEIREKIALLEYNLDRIDPNSDLASKLVVRIAQLRWVLNEAE